MNCTRFSRDFGALFVLIGLAGMIPNAQGQTLQSQSNVGVSNSAISPFISNLDFANSNTGAPTQAQASKSFTGMDRLGGTQTMTFNGETRASAQFGQLRSFTTGTVANSYYNAGNPIYYNSGTGSINPNGSPDGLVALGFAIFEDTLQFGGSLQSGYKARYLFHVDGTNSGPGALASLSVSIAGNPAENFFVTEPGFTSRTFATQSYDVNGITPQTVHVQFSSQVVLNTQTLPDGTNATGTADFSATATLFEVQVVDSLGQPVTGVSYSAASGTTYVPEPAFLAAFAAGCPLLLRRRRNLRKP